MGRHQHRRLSVAVDAWVDDELDDRTALLVAAHLKDCFDCSSAVETARLIKRSLGAEGGARHLAVRHLAMARLARFADRLVGT